MHEHKASYRALIRYSARLILAWEPVMVTCLSVEPSTGLAILIWAPDIWRISLIFAPWRPMMQPMSWGGGRRRRRKSVRAHQERYKQQENKTLKTQRAHDLHRLEWSARESQFVQRHPSQLKKCKEIPWVCWLDGLLQIYRNHIPSFNLSTYPGSPGCYVQWGRGSAAWPAGEVWWAVETMEERTWRANKHRQKLWVRKNLEGIFKAEIL